MSFWRGETLEAELPKLISPFDANRIDCAAYTLRVGAEVYVSPSNGAEAAGSTKRSLDEKESFLIPPGQFAFLATEERVRVPSNALGLISMKARIKFRGLVNVSGFHVDPGYDGYLVFAVFNAGPSAVHLARGDDCFLIWYASLDDHSARVRKSPPLNGISSDLINPIAGEVQSLANLASRLDKVERAHTVLMWAGTALFGIAATILVRGCIQQPTQSPSSQALQIASPVTPAAVPSGSPAAAPVAPAPSTSVPPE